MGWNIIARSNTGKKTEATMSLIRLRVSVVLFIAVLATVPLSAQIKFAPALTPDCQPDIQGVWTFATITPLERPADLARKAFFTEAEVAAYEKDVLART